MNIGHLYKAIKARWDAQSLDDTISGGLRWRRPKNETAPYVLMTIIGSAPSLRASAAEDELTQYRSTQVQLLLVDKGGPEVAATKMTALRAAFDWAGLSLDSGTALFCRFAGEVELDDESPGNPNAVLWAATYDLLTAESEALA